MDGALTPEWLGHRDLCPLQWHQPCTCPGGPELLAEQEASTPAESLDQDDTHGGTL